jgi:hypothetical protein
MHAPRWLNDMIKWLNIYSIEKKYIESFLKLVPAGMNLLLYLLIFNNMRYALYLKLYCHNSYPLRCSRLIFIKVSNLQLTSIELSVSVGAVVYYQRFYVVIMRFVKNLYILVWRMIVNHALIWLHYLLVIVSPKNDHITRKAISFWFLTDSVNTVYGYGEVELAFFKISNL